MSLSDQERTKLTPAQEAEVEHYEDTEGLSPHDARVKALGHFAIPAKSNNVATYHLPGKPSRFPSSGHVYDFTGREDEFRGDSFMKPQTAEEVTSLQLHLPDMIAEKELIIRRSIQHGYLDGEITFTDACGRYRTKFGDRKPELIAQDLGDGGFYTSSIKRIE